MIVSAPGMKARGSRTRALVEFVDMYPSLAALCGLPVPEHCEGLSFVPLMEDPDRAWKKAAFSQYPRGAVMGYTMRTDRYRYTEWRDIESGKVVARELYNHHSDPGETVNLADQPIYADVVKYLVRALQAGPSKQASRN